MQTKRKALADAILKFYNDFQQSSRAVSTHQELMGGPPHSTSTPTHTKFVNSGDETNTEMDFASPSGTASTNASTSGESSTIRIAAGPSPRAALSPRWTIPVGETTAASGSSYQSIPEPSHSILSAGSSNPSLHFESSCALRNFTPQDVSALQSAAQIDWEEITAALRETQWYAAEAQKVKEAEKRRSEKKDMQYSEIQSLLSRTQEADPLFTKIQTGIPRDSNFPNTKDNAEEIQFYYKRLAASYHDGLAAKLRFAFPQFLMSRHEREQMACGAQESRTIHQKIEMLNELLDKIKALNPLKDDYKQVSFNTQEIEALRELLYANQGYDLSQKFMLFSLATPPTHMRRETKVGLALATTGLSTVFLPPCIPCIWNVPLIVVSICATGCVQQQVAISCLWTAHKKNADIEDANAIFHALISKIPELKSDYLEIPKNEPLLGLTEAEKLEIERKKNEENKRLFNATTNFIEAIEKVANSAEFQSTKAAVAAFKTMVMDTIFADTSWPAEYQAAQTPWYKKISCCW